MINVTTKDVLASTLVPPGWYITEVKSVATKPASTDQSTNFNFRLEIVADLKGDMKYAEVGMKPHLINEKGLFSSGLTFLLACGMPQDIVDKLKRKEIASYPVDENACVGMKIKTFVKNSTFEGRTSNEASDFLPWDGKFLT